MNKKDSLIKRAEAYFNEGMFDPAISNYSQAIAEDGQSSRLYCMRAKAYLAKAWEEAGRAPLDDDAYDSWSAAFSRKPVVQLALNDARQAIALDACNNEAHYGLGVILSDKQCWPEAIAALDKCLELNSDDSSALYLMATAYEEMGDTAKTLETLDRVMAITTENSEAYYLRSQINTAREEFEPALEDINRAIDLSPEPEYYLQRGKVLSYMAERPVWEERITDAIKDLSEALRLDPEYAEAYNWRSLAYLQAADGEKALTDLNSLIELEPGYAEAYRHRYECNSICGNRPEAARDWLYYCYLSPAAAADPLAEAASGARASFKEFRGN